jgi:hypothetical protein
MKVLCIGLNILKYQVECLNVCSTLTDAIYEINGVNTQRLGDTVLL